MENNRKDYEDMLSNWTNIVFKKNKTLNEYLTFDKNIPYWKLHRFRFARLLYKIPFRDTNSRYKPIIDNKPNPFYIRIRTKIIYFFIKFHLLLTLFYYLFAGIWKKTRKQRQKKLKRICFLIHENQIKLNKDGNVKEVYRFQGFREQIKKQDDMEEILLVCTPLLKPWKKPKINGDYILLNNSISLFLIKKTFIETIRLWRKWNKVSYNNKKNIFENNGRYIYQYIKEDLEFLFSFPFMYVLLFHYFLIKNAITEYQIDIMLTISGLRERCAIAACHRLNIPSVFVAHATIDDGRFFDFFPKTNYFVYGKISKNKLQKESNIPDSLIHIIGPYLIDKVIVKYIKKKKIKNKKKSLLILTQSLYVFYGEKHTKSYLNILFKNLGKLKNVSIKIKLHPREHLPEIWLEPIKTYLNNYKIINCSQTNKNENILYNAIHKSDICLTFFSNTVLDALALNKPVILVGLRKNWNYFTEANSLIRVHYSDDIASIIKKILYDIPFQKKINSKMKKDIKKYYFKLDGRSSERALHKLKKII